MSRACTTWGATLPPNRVTRVSDPLRRRDVLEPPVLARDVNMTRRPTDPSVHDRFVRLLCPDPPRRIPFHRWLGILFRTVHLLAVGTLLGGHVFDVESTRLVPFLAAAIVTGAALVALELASTCAWLGMGKGVAVLLKLGLLLLVPVFWEHRVALLVAATVVAGVASHMPARYRHAPVVGRRDVTHVITPAAPPARRWMRQA